MPKEQHCHRRWTQVSMFVFGRLCAEDQSVTCHSWGNLMCSYTSHNSIDRQALLSASTVPDLATSMAQ